MRSSCGHEDLAALADRFGIRGGEVLHEEVGTQEGVGGARLAQILLDGVVRGAPISLNTLKRQEHDLLYATSKRGVDDGKEMGVDVGDRGRTHEEEPVYTTQHLVQLRSRCREVEVSPLNFGGDGSPFSAHTSNNVLAPLKEMGNNRRPHDPGSSSDKNSALFLLHCTNSNGLLHLWECGDTVHPPKPRLKSSCGGAVVVIF
ncbi:MAG: hypothetical protein QM705_04170 [Ancrocorticia sp.]